MEIKVSYVIFSLEAYNRVGIDSLLGYVIESPLPNILPINVPGPFTFIVSIMLIGLKDNEGCVLGFIIEDEESVIFETGNLIISPGEIDAASYIPDEFSTRFVSFKLFDVPFKMEGKHRYTVLINGKVKKTDDFGVFQIPRGEINGK